MLPENSITQQIGHYADLWVHLSQRAERLDKSYAYLVAFVALQL